MNITTDKIEEILKGYDDPRSEIIAVLEEVQKTFGCLPKHALREVADRTKLSLEQIIRIADSSDGLILEEQIKQPIEICNCPNCMLNGGRKILGGLREILLVRSCSARIRFFITTCANPESPCLEPPTVVVNGKRHQNMTLTRLLEMLQTSEPALGTKTDDKILVT